MSILRAPQPDRGFTIIRDKVARDSRLSYRARGVLLAVLSRPDNWRTDSEQLAREGKEGRDAIRSALRELEVCGYIRRERIRSLAPGGKWLFKTETVVFDQPTSDDGFSGVGSDDKPAGRSDDGFPGVGFPGVGNPGPIPRTEKETKEQNLSSANADEEELRPDVERLCNLLADLIEGNGSKRPTIGKQWRNTCRLMLDKDGRDPIKAENLMRWALADPFWRSNILSMIKFRAQYDQLRLRALAEHAARKPKHPTTEDRVQQTSDNLRDLAKAMTDGYGTIPIAIGAGK